MSETTPRDIAEELMDILYNVAAGGEVDLDDRLEVAALVAAAEERGAAKERERAAKGAAGLRGSHSTMKRGILCLQLATPDDAMESIRRALPDLIAAYAELTVPPVGPPGAERWPS